MNKPPEWSVSRLDFGGKWAIDSNHEKIISSILLMQEWKKDDRDTHDGDNFFIFLETNWNGVFLKEN